MQEFFTWAMLGTYAGAVLVTTIVTQFLKGIGPIDRIPTRVFSYVIALIVLLAAQWFNGAGACRRPRCASSTRCW